jgi:hypothetical protein
MWAADWLKLAVPMVFKELGPDKLEEVITRGSQAVGLRPSPSMTPTLGKILAQWAESVLAQYQAERTTFGDAEQMRKTPNHPARPTSK